MAWSDLAGNRAVNGNNLSGSGIVAKPGQSLPTGMKEITRAQANAWLSVQPVPNDNKLVLKQELIPASTKIQFASNAAGTEASSGAACAYASEGGLSLYSDDGTFNIDQFVYLDAYGNTKASAGYYAFVSGGTAYWILVSNNQFAQGYIENRGVCVAPNYVVFRSRIRPNVGNRLYSSSGSGNGVRGTSGGSTYGWTTDVTVTNDDVFREGRYVAAGYVLTRVGGQYSTNAFSGVSFRLSVWYNGVLQGTNTVANASAGTSGANVGAFSLYVNGLSVGPLKTGDIIEISIEAI